MKKLLSILVIFLTSLFLAGEALSLPNCVGTWSSSSWNNCFGQYIWTGDGGKYIGEWKDGKRNGQGTFTYPDGNKYVGEFKDDKKNGQGSYTFSDGRITEGIWQDGKFKYAQ